MVGESIRGRREIEATPRSDLLPISPIVQSANGLTPSRMFAVKLVGGPLAHSEVTRL